MKVLVGKGAVTIDDSLLDKDGKNYIVMKIITESGPCTDAMCQVITSVEATREDSVKPEFIVFPAMRKYLAMDPVVYRSIDRGREFVSVRESRHSALIVRNFSFVQ